MGPLTIFVAAPLVGLNLLDPVKAIGAFPGKKGHILRLAYNFGGFAHLPETYPVKFSCPRARVKGAWRMCVHQREWGETRAPCNPRTEQDGGVALLPSPGRTFQREPRNQGTQSNTCTASLRSASRAHTRQSPYGFVNVGTLQGQVALTFTRFLFLPNSLARGRQDNGFRNSFLGSLQEALKPEVRCCILTPQSEAAGESSEFCRSQCHSSLDGEPETAKGDEGCTSGSDSPTPPAAGLTAPSTSGLWAAEGHQAALSVRPCHGVICRLNP